MRKGLRLSLFCCCTFIAWYSVTMFCFILETWRRQTHIIVEKIHKNGWYNGKIVSRDMERMQIKCREGKTVEVVVGKTWRSRKTNLRKVQESKRTQRKIERSIRTGWKQYNIWRLVYFFAIFFQIWTIAMVVIVIFVLFCFKRARTRKDTKIFGLLHDTFCYRSHNQVSKNTYGQ